MTSFFVGAHVNYSHFIVLAGVDFGDYSAWPCVTREGSVDYEDDVSCLYRISAAIWLAVPTGILVTI